MNQLFFLLAFVGSPADDNAAVSAQVNGEVILERDVDRELARVVKNPQLDPQVRKALRSEMIQRLIDQRLIAQSLAKEKLWVSEQDLDFAEARLKKQLQSRGQTVEDFLAKNDLDRIAFRQQLQWKEGWGGYLKKHLTDANIEKYFDEHRAEYDGTKLKVAQILLPVEPQDAKGLESAWEQAQQIRAEIVAGKLTFAEAAQQYSTGPSAKTGGELGFIGRREPMPDAFSKAAYSIPKGMVTEPVTTTFGVHLIQWTEALPGNKTWFDARNELEQEMTQFLFRRIADRARKNAKIELP